MGLLDKFFPKKKDTAPPVDINQEKKPRKPRAPKAKSAKELATERNEPWVSVLAVELDPDNVGTGAFELDWNEIFIAKLVKSGYMKSKDDTDRDIVDRWFQDVCRNVVLETYEQMEANNPRSMVRRDIGNNRTEIG